ncbi:hypothetical protein CsSME_00001258 [Camellia sinensis var. sinensis]
MKISSVMVHHSPTTTATTTDESSKHFMKKRVLDFTMLSFLFIGLLYILVSIPSNDKSLFSSLNSHHHPSTMYNMTIYRDELEAILAKTATENKIVIIAVVNKAYVEGDKSMLDLFLDGFWLGDDTRGLRDHLLIVAVDQTAYERCMFLKLHCYKLETDGVDYDGEKLFMSGDFVKMMWRRTLFLGDVLKRGYNFIFTDTDVIWLRNPFPRLNPNETIDLQISTDVFYGDEWSESNKINTGFYMIRSNNKTIALFDNWYAKKDNSTGMKEQDVLEMLMHEGVFKGLGLRVRFLDTLFFSGFCQKSSDVSAVVTVHANCCRSISAKLTDLMDVIHHWKTFKNLPTNETLTIEWSRHLACINSWKF